MRKPTYTYERHNTTYLSKKQGLRNTLIITRFFSRYPLCLLFLSPRERRVYHRCSGTLVMASRTEDTRLSDTRPHGPIRLRIPCTHNVLSYIDITNNASYEEYIPLSTIYTHVCTQNYQPHYELSRGYANFSILTPTKRISFPFGFSRASRNGSMRRNISV